MHRGFPLPYNLLMIRSFPPYGFSSRDTLSPTKTLIRWMRIFPERYARTSSPLSVVTRNIVFGNASVITPAITDAFCFSSRITSVEVDVVKFSVSAVAQSKSKHRHSFSSFARRGRDTIRDLLRGQGLYWEVSRIPRFLEQ